MESEEIGGCGVDKRPGESGWKQARQGVRKVTLLLGNVSETVQTWETPAKNEVNSNRSVAANQVVILFQLVK